MRHAPPRHGLSRLSSRPRPGRGRRRSERLCFPLGKHAHGRAGPQIVGVLARTLRLPATEVRCHVSGGPRSEGPSGAGGRCVRVLNRPARLVLAAVAAASLSPCAMASAAGTPHVLLGDSYSSGEGAGPFDRGTDTVLDCCHRSANAWPRLLGVRWPTTSRARARQRRTSAPARLSAGPTTSASSRACAPSPPRAGSDASWSRSVATTCTSRRSSRTASWRIA